MFNKSFWAMKQDLAHGQGIGYSLFGGQGFAKGDSQAILNYNTALKNGVAPAKAWATTMSNASVAAQNATRDTLKAKGSLTNLANGLQVTSVKAKAASVGLKALSVAANMLMVMGISMAISGIVKGFQALANAQERAIEKADEFISKFNEQREALTRNKKSIDSISSDYERLSKGVDSLGRNVSLNSTEYARYNEIVNQIADMFPQMVQGYTDEGNAIIAHKGNVEELTKAYEEQKKAAQDAIIVGSADVFAGFKAATDKTPKYVWEESGSLQMKQLVDKIVATGGDVEKIQEVINGLGGNSLVIGDVFDKIGLDKGRFDWNTQDAEYISENIKKFQSLFNTLNTEVEAQAAKIKPIMQAYLEQSYEYQGLDEDVQDIVKQVIGQFDSEFYAQFDNETEMASWVTENITNKFKGKDGEKMSSEFQMMLGIQTQFNKGEITVSKYQEKLSAFLKTIEPLPDETEKYIKLLFGISTGSDGKTSSDVDTMVANVEKKFKGKFKNEIGQLKLDELEILTNLDISPDGIKDWAEVKTLIANARKESDGMTASLSDLEKASDNIKPLGTAFKELSDDGYITIKTLKEMKDAADLSSDEWAEYEGKLLNAKVGSSEFNRVMSDLTYKILDNTFAGKELNNLTEQQIAAVLRENSVVNASAVAHDWLAKAKAKEKVASMELVKGSELDIKALAGEASACNVAKNAYLELVAKEILFNRNDLDVEDKVKKLNQIAAAAGVAGINMDTLNSKFGSDSEKRKYIEENGGKITTTTASRTSPYTNPLLQLPGMQPEGSDIPIKPYISPITNPLLQLPGMQPEQIIEYELSDGTKTTDINEAIALVEMGKVVERITNAANNIIIPNYSGAAKDGSDKNEALDNYLKDAENRYKIHQDETKYIQELQWAYGNLTKNEKERLDITGKINEAYRDLADNRIKDIEHQIDLAKELNEYADVTDYYKQIQNVAHEEADRLRAMGYDDNSNEIQDLQKTWWDAQKSIVDWRWDNSNRWIDERNTYNDWNLFDDSEIDAWERVIKWLNEDYPNDLEKIKEAEQSLFEARKKEFNKGTDFGNTYLDSKKTLLQSYYDVTNSIAEAQHEINKELETSKTMYEYLDEDTRKLLFNQEDYNELSEELLDIQYRADKLQRQYKRDLDNSTLETIESITSEYQMQYETLMKSYEVAKADLEIAKKKQKLNNVLNERNVRMFINGSWQWVANTEDVVNAKSELADAEYAKRVEEAGLTQQQSINNLTKQQDELSVVIKSFENGVIDLEEAVKQAEEAIGGMPSALASIFNNAKVDTGSSYSSASGGGGGSGGYSGGSSSRDGLANVYKSNDYSVSIASALAAGDLETALHANKIRNDKIDYLGLDVEKWSDDDIKKRANAHASGTRYTPGGLTLMGEEGSEVYITANGRLIPINQPTIGNISSGGVVFNREQMKNLRTMWDMSNLNFKGGSDIVSTAQPQQIDQSQDNRIIINGMTVDSGSADGQALISALRRYVGNH